MQGMYNKSTCTVHYFIDGPTDAHTHTHPKNRTEWSLFGPPARRTVGLKTRVCLGPVHLVWSSRRPGTSERRAEPGHRRATLAVLAGGSCLSSARSCGGGGGGRRLRRRPRPAYQAPDQLLLLQTSFSGSRPASP